MVYQTGPSIFTKRTLLGTTLLQLYIYICDNEFIHGRSWEYEMGMIEWIINGDILGRNNQRTQDINRDDMIMSSLLGASIELTRLRSV